jgi:hypothetical protein
MDGMRCRPSVHVDGADTKLAGTTCLVLPPGPCNRPPTDFILNTNNIKSKGLMIGNPFLLIALAAQLTASARRLARGRRLITLQATLIAFLLRSRHDNSKPRALPAARQPRRIDAEIEAEATGLHALAFCLAHSPLLYSPR